MMPKETCMNDKVDGLHISIIRKVRKIQIYYYY